MTIEQTIEIARPVGEVYAYLCDETNLLEWREGLTAVERLSPPGPLDGALYRETIATRLGPQTVVVQLKTRHLRSLSFSVVEGPVKSKGTLELRPLGAHVALTYRVEVAPVLRLPTPLDRIVAKTIFENVERSLANLKRVLASTANGF